MSTIINNISKFQFTLLALFCFIGFAHSQPSSIDRKKDPYSWMFGVSWNVVDDNGQAFTKLFDYKDSWNYLYYPSRITVDKYIRRGWSMEGMAAYNYYSSSKLINDTTGLSGRFFSVDFHMKYSFYRFFAPAKWFDPYFSFGLGVTYRQVMDPPITPTVNLALGANFWFSKSWGMQVQTMGKLGIVPDIYVSKTDYLQHTVGVVYRRSPKMKHSKNNKKRHKWIHEKQRFKRKNT